MDEQADDLIADWTLDGDTATVRVAGEIDIATRATLTEAAQAAVAAGASRLVLDMSEVTFMDSSGIAALIDMRTAATVLLRRPSDVVERLIVTTGLTDTLAVEP